MVKSETFQRQTASGSVFRPPEDGGGTQRYQVSGVNDPEEVRAERTAGRIMGGVFRESGGLGSGSGGLGPEGGQAELASSDLAGPGSALPPGLQDFMSSSIGADFSNVRVHTDAGADRASRQLSARAFTWGEDVYFRGGEYDPGSREGQHLIAHELAHVASGASGLHRVVDVMNDDPTSLTKEQAQEVSDYVEEKKNNFINALRNNCLEEMKKKYVERTEAIQDSEIANDKIKIEAMQNAVEDANALVNKLKEGADADNVIDEIKSAYRNGESSLRQEIGEVKDAVKTMVENVEKEKIEADSATISETVKEMVNDPAFAKFKAAVDTLRTVGDGFAAANEAAAAREESNTGKKSAGVSLKEKQKAVGVQAAVQEEFDWSKSARFFGTVGGNVSALSAGVGTVASASTAFKERKKENAAKIASKNSGAASGITKGVGELISGAGGTLNTIHNSKQVTAQKEQDIQAKKSMRNIARHLERSVPKGRQDEPRSQRIKAVCDRVEQDQFNKGKESMGDLISAAMDEEDANVTPPLSAEQKKLLSAFRMLESSRAASKEGTKKMRKEEFFSALDTIGSFARGIGSSASGVGSIINSSLVSLIGSVFSLAGSIIGQIGVYRKAMATKGGEDVEKQKKMAASLEAIRQMAALPEVKDEVWDKAKGAAGTVSREDMGKAEQYAGVFYSIHAANVNMADILFAIEKGEFGKGAGTDQAKSTEASLDDMYANLSMS